MLSCNMKRAREVGDPVPLLPEVYVVVGQSAWAEGARLAFATQAHLCFSRLDALAMAREKSMYHRRSTPTHDMLVSENENKMDDHDAEEEDQKEEDEDDMEEDQKEDDDDDMEEEEEEEENSQLAMALAEVYPGDDTSLVLNPDGSMLAFFTPYCNEFGDPVWEDDHRPSADCSPSHLMNAVRPAAPALLAFLAINQLRGFGSIRLPRSIALLIARLAHEEWATNITFGMLPIAGEADAVNVIVLDALSPTFEIFFVSIPLRPLRSG